MEPTEVQLLHSGDVELAKMVVTTLRTQRDVIIGLIMDRESVSFIRFWNEEHWPCLNDVPEGRLYTCVLPSNGVAERLDRFIAWLESEIDCFQEPETTKFIVFSSECAKDHLDVDKIYCKPLQEGRRGSTQLDAASIIRSACQSARERLPKQTRRRGFLSRLFGA